jgi:hypothetical protein
VLGVGSEGRETGMELLAVSGGFGSGLCESGRQSEGGLGKRKPSFVHIAFAAAVTPARCAVQRAFRKVLRVGRG